MDPYNEKVGYIVPAYEADVVTVSHGHFDHANVEAVAGNPIIIKDIGEYSEQGFSIIGISSFHDDQQGAVRGKNNIYVIEADGKRVCHLGDIGHILPAETVEKIGEVDVLLLPVGGFYTAPLEVVNQIRKQIAPKVTVPIHYKTDVCLINIAPLSSYLDEIKGAAVEYTENEIDLDKLDTAADIIVMDYK